jgi:hypothetical protein
MKKSKTVFNVFYYNSTTGELIDQTQIDEHDEKLAWELFAEFGHKRKKSYKLEMEPVQED